MNFKINANAALSFLLRNEYNRFVDVFTVLQEQKIEEGEIKEEDKQEPPTFEEWLILNKVAQKESSVVGLDGQKLKVD